MASVQSPAPVSSGPYELGRFIELHHFLALPPGDPRYERDEEGRLAPMSPDDLRPHRVPLVTLAGYFHRRLESPYFVLHEGGVAFERIYDLSGNLLPPSFLGRKTLEPDFVIFDRSPSTIEGPEGRTVAAPEGIRLVVEIVSAGTWRSDLGVGRADQVDKRRSYLESGVPEYWILNAGVAEAARRLPVRSGQFLAARRDRSAWEPIPVRKGIVRSRSIRGLTLDLEAYWTSCQV